LKGNFVLEDKNKYDIKKTDDSFYIVGIGASAGGLSAFESFFSALPTNNNIDIAFVLIQHLAPDHKSLLTELIQHCTNMRVYEVENGMKVQKNCVYIIPPNYDMKIYLGTLYLENIPKLKSQHLPIDLFFDSLAKDKQDKSIGVILSGTGHDGEEGIKAIKKVGGLVLAQSIESSKSEGMPKSAIETGIVDNILTPSEMPKKILNYVNSKIKKQTPISINMYDEKILKEIFLLLQNQTSHDFSMYKPSTISRRIERRLAINKIDTIQEYYEYLKRSKNEINTLFSDLLIGVTNFFRDEDVFISLEKNAIAKLFLGKTDNSTVRVWIAGCSTGEEAYSIAILIMEYMQKIKQRFTVQIFATDIDEAAIAIARAGVYPLSISTNISKERVENFFIKNSDNNTYRIHKNIRDMLVFSVHDVIKDPPFSKLDLISCRNLLIYMNIELQQKVISIFHYALNQKGILLLGNSETLGELASAYNVLDAKAKLFECQKNPANNKRTILTHIVPTNQKYNFVQYMNKLPQGNKLPLRELAENAILEQIAPSAVLVNEQGDILYIHGKAGMYLELPSGETNTNNIFKMAKDGLKNYLILAFQKAKIKKQIVHKNGLAVKINGNISIVNITIKEVSLGLKIKQEIPLYIVLLQEDFYGAKEEIIEENISDINIVHTNLSHENLNIQSLKQELQLQKAFLQDANEKLETSNEELKSYNEEIQSMNEELQSTNEELETSKEELQSVNEELSTVNSELNMKVIDLSRSNNDMNNLLAGTGIGTIFVDHNLNILRFTPAATRIINLILGDIGRSIGHIVSNMLDYNSLVSDIQNVLDTLVPKEIEVTTIDSKSYLMRIQPYRTLENVIEGAVISFVDITQMHDIKIKLKELNELSRLAIVVRDSSDAIIVEDLSGKIIAWNPGAEKLYGWSETEAINMQSKNRIPKELQEKDIKKIAELCNSKILQTYKTKRLKKDGSIINIHIVSSALIDKDENTYAITTTERQI
jgi:two-component system, chemotaxis family, CheB/CheR fusion protein